MIQKMTTEERYMPIIKEQEQVIAQQRQEIHELKLQKEEQDKHFDKLLKRITAIATDATG